MSSEGCEEEISMTGDVQPPATDERAEVPTLDFSAFWPRLASGRYRPMLERSFCAAIAHVPVVTPAGLAVATTVYCPLGQRVEPIVSQGRITSFEFAPMPAQWSSVWEPTSVRPHLLSLKVDQLEEAQFLAITLRGFTIGDDDSLLPLRFAVPIHDAWHTLPEPPNWLRTCGPGLTREHYVLSGLDTAHRIHCIIEAYGGDEGPLRVLDWGIGPGRVAVPLKRLLRPADRILGADVDRFNVDWCAEHLKDIEVLASGLYPPLPYEDESFDVIYGISVVTHLMPATIDSWLREMRRVLRPGGLCILTTHGDHHLVIRKLTEGQAVDLAERGISSRQPDHAIDLAEPAYYRSTIELRQHVIDHWSEVMPIVAYLPVAARMQDFVVMRKP
jgi:ubiquinone/menaquinone biosynthesis C-methylase UbiE